MSATRCAFVGILTLLTLSLAAADPPAEHPATGEPLVIECLRGTPDAIDGDLSDWNLDAMTPAILDAEEQLYSGQTTWDGPEDGSGEFYLLWDEQYIYMAVVMKDDKLSMNKTGGDIWNADCIEVFFSTTNAVPPHDEHYQYGFNLNEQKWNWCNMDGNGSTDPDYLMVAASETPDGYICEAAIEYAQMLSLDWSVGNAIGFHAVFDDTDNGDRELQMTWTGMEAHDQSLGFGHMILSDAPVGSGGNPLAWGPKPKDGTMIYETSTVLEWRPGAFASGHEVYFGESLEAIEAATPEDADLFIGRLAVEMLRVGSAGDPVPDELVPGQTYYWRVDEVNDLDPNSPWKGDVWSFSIQPRTAYEPFPVDGMKHVDLDQDLFWQAGMNVIYHKIFLGKSFDEVNNAVAPLTMSTATTVDIGPLELDTTYYWRIDEFIQFLGDQKGAVWSFTTRGDEGGVKAEYFDGMELAGDPVLTQTEPTIDHSWGSDEVAAGLSDNVSARWTANLEAPLSETFSLITTSDDGVRLWLDDRMIIDNWTDHGTTDNKARVDLIGGQIYLLVMEYYENTGGAVAQLSWESPTIARQIVPQGWLQLPHWATNPSPANGEPHAPQAGALSWTAGDEATAHDVYFGEDAEAVANATPADAAVYRGQQAAGATSFNPGPLQWNTTYYWRVDEINPAHDDSPWKGAVWSFTTADFIIVDDFESYTNEVGRRVFEKWVDGIGFTLPEPGHPGNGTGAAVGHDIWSAGSPHYNGLIMETRSPNSGYQAMPVYYDNTASPYRSEAEYTWTAPQNWTLEGVTDLTLYVRGAGGNSPDPLYVVLEDSSGRTGVAVHPNAAILNNVGWAEWKTPLSEFAASGVSLTAIKKMYIGIGSRDGGFVGGTGVLYVDDIRVTKP